VTVQPAISSSSAIGRPTWLLTPRSSRWRRARDGQCSQQRGDAAWRARSQAELAQGQVADILRMEAVDVLARVDAVDQLRCIAAIGQRQLHQDAVDLGIGVELSISASSRRRGLGRQVEVESRGSRPSRRPGACCARRRWRPGSLPTRHHRQAGRRLAFGDPRAINRGLQAIEQVVGDALAVEDSGWGLVMSKRPAVVVESRPDIIADPL
jgi:hypothetical protein